MEGKIDMSARMQVTNKLRNAFREASKPDKGRILDEVVSTTGLALHAQSNPTVPRVGVRRRTVSSGPLICPRWRVKSGSRRAYWHALMMVGSVPHTRMTGAEGNEQLVPLRIVNQMRRQNKDSSWCSHHVYEFSRVRGDFKHTQHWVSAEETSIIHGQGTRVYPTDTEQLRDLYRRRYAIESWHAELERNRRRLPASGVAMQSFYLCCLVVTQNGRNIERMKRSATQPGTNAD